MMKKLMMILGTLQHSIAMIIDLFLRELHVVELNLPKAEGINSTPYYTKGKQIMTEMSKKYDNVTYVEFDTMDYPVSYFGESIHYSTSGAEVLNKEFLEKIYPRLVEEINAKK